PPRRRRAGPPKRPRKGRMAKAIDVCLQQIGLKAPDHIEPPREFPRDAAPAPPPRRSSPTLAPRDPLTMDLGKLVPETGRPFKLDPSMGLENIDPTLPPPAKPETRAGNLVTTCRTALAAGANFIIHNGEPAPPPADGGLSL